MYFLVYVSSAVNLFSDDELIQLLEVSRRNNEKAEITGLLLYASGNFMQTLEGTERQSWKPRHGFRRTRAIPD